MQRFSFLSNVADIDEGLGDAGIETFRDAPYASVARECGQNSADARERTPVILTFEVLEISASDLPGLDELKTTIECCLRKAQGLNSEKEIEFFECAKHSIDREYFKILKISDRNTRGLTGPCQQGKPFHSLLKGKGVSVKDDPKAGGSFGIGKNAAYAVSDIQTVFYSTVYLDSYTNERKFLCQGKTVLVSHVDANGESKLATGYWGEENYQPVTDSNTVPGWLRRTDVGTTIFSACFRDTDNWEERLTAPLIQNFFCAIHRDEMTFTISDTLEINRETIGTLFTKTGIVQAAIDNGHGEDLDFSSSLYQCLIAVETKEEVREIEGIGRVSIKVLVKDGLPKRVCIIRNGMLITDNLENFGEKFRRFPLYKDFVALVEPLDDVGISLFRKLENPKHNGFSSERISDSRKRAAAAVAMKKLGKIIREEIKTQSLEKPKDSVVIDELSEFFADEVDPERIQDPNALEDNPETVSYKPRKRERRPPTGVGSDAGGLSGGGGTRRGKHGKPGVDGPGGGGGTKGAGDRGGGKIIRLTQMRNLIQDNDPRKRRLFITPAESGRARVTVFAEGINTPDPVQIERSNGVEVQNGSLIMDLNGNQRHDIVVEFSEPYDGPIEIIAATMVTKGSAHED